MMLITHDLGVVAQVADVVCVVYAGRVLEYARVYDLFDRPMHPYTQGLFASIPRIEDRRRRLRTVREAVSDPEAFQRLPGHQYGVVPWWPTMAPPEGIEPGAGGEHRLHEVEPEHWVACWRTPYVADHPQRPPDLDYRRPASP